MKFSVEHLSKNGGRVGYISGLRSQPHEIHQTPMFLLSTIGGSAPHLTQDALHLIVPKHTPLVVPAQHFCEHTKALKGFNKGVASFAGLQSHCVCVSVQDASKLTPSGYNDKRGVSTWTTSGRNILTADKFMNIVDVMKPDWFEALHDADTDIFSSRKRIEKSLDISNILLDQCLEAYQNMKSSNPASFFSPLLGGFSITERKRWSEAVAKKSSDIFGYCLLGFHNNGSSAEHLSEEKLSDLVKASIKPLPHTRPIQAQGAWNPLTLLSLVENGVDIFDSSFPLLVTNRQGALAFQYDLNSKLKIQSNLKDEENIDHFNKKLKTYNDEDSPILTNVLNGGRIQTFEINLSDKRYFSAMTPLLDGCKCYTCTHFTQSYVHHLIEVKELLAPVLLMIHNLHHWLKFFESIQEAIHRDELPNLKNLVKVSMNELNLQCKQ